MGIGRAALLNEVPRVGKGVRAIRDFCVFTHIWTHPQLQDDVFGIRFDRDCSHIFGLLLRARSLALMESALGVLNSLTVFSTRVKSRIPPS